MKKKLLASFTIMATALWLAALPAAAQKPGGNHGHPGGGASGMHEPMGMGSAMNGGRANGHAMNGHGNGSAMGPKSPSELLAQNTKLASKLAPLAGCTGTASQVSACMQLAESGFKNLGQFVAAVHVSNNLGIPFAQLQCTELGTTEAASLKLTCPASVMNTGSMSLGGAIHTIKPTLSSTDVKNSTNEATKQAHGDLSKS